MCKENSKYVTNYYYYYYHYCFCFLEGSKLCRKGNIFPLLLHNLKASCFLYAYRMAFPLRTEIVRSKEHSGQAIGSWCYSILVNYGRKARYTTVHYFPVISAVNVLASTHCS
jgi:hypothetical protein